MTDASRPPERWLGHTGSTLRRLLERSSSGGVAARATGVLALAAMTAVALSPSGFALKARITATTAVVPADRTVAADRPGAASLGSVAAGVAHVDISRLKPHARGRPVLDTVPLLLALDLLHQSVLDRVAADSDAAGAELDQSLLSLERATQALESPAHRLTALPAGVALSIANYRTAGRDLVRAADQQRAAVQSYRATLQGVVTRLDQSIDATHSFFGRLLGRAPLLELRADVTAIAHQGATPAAGQLNDPARAPSAMAAAPDADPTGVADLEHNALANLEAHQKSLIRSQGDSWYRSMHADLARLPMLRETAATLGTQLRERALGFDAQSRAVTAAVPAPLAAAQIPDAIPTPVTRFLPVAAISVGAAALPQAATRHFAAVASAGRAAAAAVPAVAETPSVRAAPAADSGVHRWSVGIAVAATLLLLYVLFGTALGIVLPVRRLIRATRMLAAGDDQVQVARGGLKELDQLVAAFNDMAAALAVAKSDARQCENEFRSTISTQTQRLEELAKRDPLTGLDNRRELLARLNEAIDRAHAADRLVGVLFLDIDNFKYINDSMGHLFGDRLLISLSQRLQETTQAFGRAGRLGGDEFTVIIDRAHGIEEIQAAGLAVLQAFQEPLTVDDQELHASVSVGASVYPYHARDAAALLQAADAALFRAKALGRSKLSLYTAELAELGAAKITTEQGLRRAIERGEFELVFQPEISAATLDVTVVEALIRWRVANGNLLGPEQFLSIAEDSGLIVDISNWVLQAAVEAAARWYHGAWPEARVAINVSPRQLLDQRFVDRLQGLLQEHRLPARCIEIELTESVLQTGPATIEALKRLRAKGIAIALDDFGTGYSSFASLEKLPLTRVKLDRSLIASIDVSPRSAAIARGIISMCQGLGLEITAEGVERTAQLALLADQRLMCLQGFLFARPVAREELMPLMAKMTERAQALLASSQLLTASTLAASDNVIELATSPRRLSEAG